jgi:short-subunit dehydrogenase
MNYDFKNKVSVVTGASEGIGLAVARLLGAAGAKVVLAARSADKLEQAAAEIPGSSAVRTDLRSPADIKKLLEEAIRLHGRVDILVNNAGQGIYGPFEKVPLEKFREVMELNVFALMDLMQQVIPVMRAQGGGRIINVSSMVSKNSFPNLSAYAATKYAVNALSLTARKELEKDGIVVSLMHPKMTATRFGVNAVGGNKADTRANGQAAPGVDTAGDVAKVLMKLIESGEAEASM